MTISEIKSRTQETSPYYFTRKTLKFFGQTMRSFRVYKQPDGRFRIQAPILGNQRNLSIRYFNPKTNRLEHN